MKTHKNVPELSNLSNGDDGPALQGVELCGNDGLGAAFCLRDLVTSVTPSPVPHLGGGNMFNMGNMGGGNMFNMGNMGGGNMFNMGNMGGGNMFCCLIMRLLSPRLCAPTPRRRQEGCHRQPC